MAGEITNKYEELGIGALSFSSTAKREQKPNIRDTL
jgi:hypothetical protein